ncbi:MAG: hydroxyacid dehydrogenase [Oscillatoria sp. PMC 1051.18]|nr:hydroxyacid dehydrogenase [Oscillatoria sp. PMC 1050.18]MEC5031074.1 hydroxyacid dehydrogenase [Oscillatoria sp. PMC 1051.18]
MTISTKNTKVLYLPNKIHTERVFSEEVFSRLNEQFDVTQLASGSESNCTSEQVAEAIPGFAALITGWGTPRLSREVFERADSLQIISHSAGSVKGMLLECAYEYVIPRGICVFSANRAIACNAAEHTIGLAIAASRKIFDRALMIRSARDGWPDRMLRPNAQYLTGSTVGIVSASQVGRKVIELLRPFDTKVLVFDPYLTENEAKTLKVKKVELMDVFSQSDIVSVHAPLLPETRSMIRRAHFRALKDGAVFINTSRGAILDEQALIAELETGRISAAIDVATEEPLPKNNPLLSLKNVIVTPHLAGSGYYGYARIGESTVQALEDFFAGRPVEGAIDFEKYDIIA